MREIKKRKTVCPAKTIKAYTPFLPPTATPASTSTHILISLALFLFLLLIILPPAAGAAGTGSDEASFSRGGVTPSSGDSDTTFLFTVTLTAPSAPSSPVEVVINNRSHAMSEVEPQDTNYSDGKDFEYREKFEAGGVIYYFRCGNVTTPVSTISVTTPKIIKWHIDVAIVAGLFVIPVIYTALLLRRLMERTEALTNTVAGIENHLTEQMTGKEIGIDVQVKPEAEVKPEKRYS